MRNKLMLLTNEKQEVDVNVTSDWFKKVIKSEPNLNRECAHEKCAHKKYDDAVQGNLYTFCSNTTACLCVRQKAPTITFFERDGLRKNMSLECRIWIVRSFFPFQCNGNWNYPLPGACTDIRN